MLFRSNCKTIEREFVVSGFKKSENTYLLPFEVEDVENVEMYHYDGVPASAEKKVVVAEHDIKTLYDKFKDLSLKDKTTEETAGADVTSFRSVSYTHLDVYKRQGWIA